MPIEARTAAEALALLDNGARGVDAMVTDSTCAAAPWYCERGPAAPTSRLLASGYAEKGLDKLAGVDRIAYMPKPYDAAALRAALVSLGIAALRHA